MPVRQVAAVAATAEVQHAVTHRRARDWVVFAIYLAGTVTVIAAFPAVRANVSVTGFPAVTFTLLPAIAPVRAVLAFSPAAKVPSWHDAYPAWTVGKHQQPVVDVVPPENSRQDIDPRHSMPIPADSD